MANEPQREIEKDLLAYKQRRREQLGAPLELHPATRKMLQSEAARVASRPLLTSEEAAKNFVRSFAMSHQRPSFFARYRHRVIWGGAMFASLVIVLAVLRNDPQQAARQRTFPDVLPTPPAPVPAATPAPTAKPQSAVVASQPAPEVEPLARARNMPRKDTVSELAKAPVAPVAAPAPTASRGMPMANKPLLAVQREAEPRNAAAPAEFAASAFRSVGSVAGAAAPTSGSPSAKTDSPVRLGLAADAEVKRADQNLTADRMQLAKALNAEPALGGAFVPDPAKTSAVLLQRRENAEAKSAPPAAAPLPVTAPAPPAQALMQTKSSAAVTQMSQRFQQLDSQSGYRQNFNSPPLPQVMQDFAFERTGDRVRIVDADGSTYEGTVLPTAAEELRAKSTRQLADEKERKEVAAKNGQENGALLAYRFRALGVNRKLNQSVEFRGEWQPAAPAPAPTTLPALQPTSFGVSAAEKPAGDKAEKAAANALTSNGAPTQAFLQQGPKEQAQKETHQGRISGRAVVGGKDEFQINAVPK